ncbi:MAG: TetR family transcriptional regulator C-terminal domain-containing protein [Thermoleophilia bacterium]|nr:TetR family transcriptional regulator C-terminal domain-containing protein [Thermoleophilia bacterium]
MGRVRRPQILDAAARVIARRGVTGLRLADVAEEAGVSVGSIQHYFGTRERLLSEAFAHELERALERWAAPADGSGDAWGRLVALVDIVLEPRTFRERWTRWLQFWAAYARDARLRRALGRAYDLWRRPFARAFQEGIDSGEFRPALPVDVLADRAVALFDGLVLQVLLEAPGATLGRARELFLDSLAADLGVSGARAGLEAPAPRELPAGGSDALAAARGVVGDVGDRVGEVRAG